MTQNKDLRVSRAKVLKALEKRLYMPNIDGCCDGDDMIIPVEKFAIWMSDMGLMLGKAIKDVVSDDS